jgi:AraC family transcriptional regulator, L-rhamnose operon transcriptional activator RhaR
MHRILRDEIFSPAGPPVAAQRLALHEDVTPHGHAFMEFAVVTAGAATHVSSAGSQPLSRGCVLVLRPGEWHGYADVDELSVLNVYVGPEVFARELAWLAEESRLAALLRPRSRAATHQPPPEVRLDPQPLGSVERWCAELAGSRPGISDRVSRLGHLVLLLGGLAAAREDADGAAVGKPTHPAVVAAVRLIESDLTADWSISRLAQEASFSPAYLTRLFTQQLGLPPMAYLHRLRAERAGALLIETDLPVAAVGAAVGWVDPSYASRRFRACFAMSPAQYRASFRPPA